MTNRERVLWFLAVLVLSVVASFNFNSSTDYKQKYEKARVCNKGFQLYLYYNQGIRINLDKFYEDVVKWVDDPQYQVEGIK